MKGFERLSDELSGENGPLVLNAVHLSVRGAEPDGREGEGRHQTQAVTFEFERLSLHVICDGEHDEVTLLVGEALPWPDAVTCEISEDPPWPDILGLTLALAWVMTNHRGFDDALQLRFLAADDEDGDEETLQFEALASELRISRLDPDVWSFDPFEELEEE